MFSLEIITGNFEGGLELLTAHSINCDPICDVITIKVKADLNFEEKKLTLIFNQNLADRN